METPLVFGDDDNLVGVAQLPPAPSSRCGVLLLTPGMLHHVGPYRLHVRLARELATLGIPSLRYDLSGIGESLAVGQAGSSLERAASEASQAMDRMQSEYAIETFVLFGICSGADDGLYIGQHDDRVVGLAMLDGCGYRTPRYHWHRATRHLWPRLTNREKWADFLTRGRTPPIAQSLQPGDDIREFPDRDEAERQIAALSKRGVRMRFLYTGGVAEYYNYTDQFTEMFPALLGDPHISTRFFPEMDHLAMLDEDRRVLLEDVTQWLAYWAPHSRLPTPPELPNSVNAELPNSVNSA